ncbi:MAG: DNA mismatch endonuclease Vsr, partial [Dehalococcoidia bacterium]
MADERQPRQKLPHPHPTSAAATASMRSNRSVDTAPEVLVRRELHRHGCRFRKNYVIAVPGVKARADIVFTRLRLAVFIDGCFWHQCPEHGTMPRANADYWQPKLDRNVARDERVTRLLEES